jgi:hypothetical protein
MAGRTTRRSPKSCSVTIRPGSLCALKSAIRAGAAPADLGSSLAYAAALRVARFGNANEHADWETAHHVFTYANAVHQMLKRIGTAKINGYVASVSSVLHGSMALYLVRYLNVPPARIPGGPLENIHARCIRDVSLRQRAPGRADHEMPDQRRVRPKRLSTPG